MATKTPKKKEQEVPISLPVEQPKPLLEEHKERAKKQKLSISIPGLSTFSTLMKLRVAITTVFIFITLAIVLLFANGYMISAALIILSYLILLILMIKLFRVKKL